MVLQFNFSGEVEGSCHFIVAVENISAEKGPCDHPDVTIETPFALWMDIMARKVDGQQMFMEQKYTVNGDLPLMLELFKKEPHHHGKHG